MDKGISAYFAINQNQNVTRQEKLIIYFNEWTEEKNMRCDKYNWAVRLINTDVTSDEKMDNKKYLKNNFILLIRIFCYF